MRSDRLIMNDFLRTLVCALAAGLAFLVPQASFAQTIKIGAVNSLTGPHSGFDVPASEGLHMAIDEINHAGGVTIKGKHYTMQLVEEDAQSNPEYSTSGAQRILQDEDIKIAFGMLTSGPGMPAATLFEKNGLMFFGGFTLMDTVLGKPGSELMFRTLDADDVVAKVFVPESIKTLGVKKVGILLPNEDVSRSIVETYKPLLESQGITVGPIEYFQPNTQDLAPVLRKFANQGLDGLLVGTNDAIVESLVRQSLEVGGLPKRFLYRGGSGAPAMKYVKQLDGFTWQILTRDLDYTSDAKVKQWLVRYKAFTKKDLAPNTYWALTFYDTVFMLAHAMEAAGTTSDVKAIAAQMKTTPYDGVRTMRFDKDGRCLSDFDIGILKDGSVHSVRAQIH